MARIRDLDGNFITIDTGGVSAIISETDPGAIGAGNLWVRVDPTETYAPTLQVRSPADDGWLDDDNVGLLLGLVYYDDDGNPRASVSGSDSGIILQAMSAEGQTDGQAQINHQEASLYGGVSGVRLSTDGATVILGADGVLTVPDLFVPVGGTLTVQDGAMFRVDSDAFLFNLPTADPVNAGQLWLDVAGGRVLKISAG